MHELIDYWLICQTSVAITPALLLSSVSGTQKGAEVIVGQEEMAVEVEMQVQAELVQQQWGSSTGALVLPSLGWLGVPFGCLLLSKLAV